MELNNSNNHNDRNKDHAVNVLLIMLTNMFAPLVSKILNMVFKDNNNQWSTEKIVVIYCSAITGLILFNKISRVLIKKFQINEKDYLLGNIIKPKGILLNNIETLMLTCFVTGSISLGIKCYDSLIGSILLLLFAIIAVSILWKDYQEIDLSPHSCLLIGLSAIGYTFIIELLADKTNGLQWLSILGIFIFGQFLCINLIDFVSYIIHKKHK